MVGRTGTGTVTARIAGTATRQQGLVTRRQLHEHGLDDSAIKRRVANGALYRVFHGLYLVGHQARAPLARETAALLACGKAAVISRRSAAALWSMVPRERRRGPCACRSSPTTTTTRVSPDDDATRPFT
ncbi:MAG: type IV toxin-antitoxin system AbiEi family antitoxin domain-containing protein [Solirubrobacterales bacterium]|nr:type IV toxin-antitoxin system AbiEi family antitoxin domain-containing protein [Solirubrobacterales bacterium]